MKFFVKAVVTGFALSLGAALFKKIQSQLGLAQSDDKTDDKQPDVIKQDGASDPSLQMS